MAPGNRDSAPHEIHPPGFVTDLMRDTTWLWGDLTYDSFLYYAVVDYVEQKHPRLVFVGFGETDEWAHAGRYDLLSRMPPTTSMSSFGGCAISLNP